MGLYKFLILQIILVSLSFCKVSENVSKLTDVFVDYLNNVPDQQYVYSEPHLTRTKEIGENEIYIEIKVKAIEAKDENSVKYLNCSVIMNDFGEKASVHDVQCGDYVEVVTENIEELVTDATPSEVKDFTLQDIVENKNDITTTIEGPIQLENEVQPSTAYTSGEQFIAIPRERPAPCIGCSTLVDTHASGVTELATLGVRQLDRHEPNTRHSLNDVLLVERQVQVVGGIRYILTLNIDYDNCTLFDTDGCLFQKTCKVSVLEKPWQKFADGSKFRAILANNCTEDWLFDVSSTTSINALIENDIVPNAKNSETPLPNSDDTTNDDVKVVQTVELQAQPKTEKTLTEQQIKELEEQIIPYSQESHPKPTEKPIVTDQSVTKNAVSGLEATKASSESDSAQSIEDKKVEENKEVSDLPADKIKAIDEFMHFFDFAGVPVTNPDKQNTRIKRDYGNDLEVLNAVENFRNMQNKIKNALYIHKLAQVMVDYLNEKDQHVKNRFLKTVTGAEEETENDHQYFYIQARVAVPWDKPNHKTKEKDIKTCTGIIDASTGDPKATHVVCYEEQKQAHGQFKPIRNDDVILSKVLYSAIKHMESTSETSNGFRVKNIMRALTQQNSGRLVKVTAEVEYLDCDKQTPLYKRSDCNALDNLGTKVCDFEVFMDHGWNKKQISHMCTDRPPSESFSKSMGHSVTVNSDAKVLETVEEALEYLELKSNRNNRQKVVEVRSVSKQTVAGLLTTVLFSVGYTSCKADYNEDLSLCEVLKSEPLRNCSAEVWERPWLDDGRQLKVSCEDMPESVLVKNKGSSSNIYFIGGQKEIQYTKYRKLAEDSLQNYIQTTGNSVHYVIVNVGKIIVSADTGKVTEINFQISPTNCQVDENEHPKSAKCAVQDNADVINCRTNIWEDQSHGRKTNVQCHVNNKNHVKKRSSGTPPSKKVEDNAEYTKLANDALIGYLETFGIEKHYVVELIEKVEQTSDSTLTIDFKAVPTNCSTRGGLQTSSACVKQNDESSISCNMEIENRKPKNAKITNVNCQFDEINLRKKRQLGGEMEQSVTDPEYQKLAEEATTKYVLTSGKTQYHKVTKIYKVSTQVVSGIKTKINFKIAPTECSVDSGEQSSFDCRVHGSGTLRCTADIWQKPSKSKKDITVKCSPIRRRNKREETRKIVGGLKPKDPKSPEYQKLAEDSLTEYVISSGINQYHKVIDIEKVTTQVVSGLLTRINFKASETDCLVDNNGLPTSSVCNIKDEQNVLNCFTKIWEQPWKDEKKINITCQHGSNIETKRKRSIPGGAKSQDPKDPKYSKLAEESLEQYVTSNGITKYHKVIEITHVATQVVSGTLTKIDFKIAPTNCLVDSHGKPTSSACEVDNQVNAIICHAHIWEQPWRKFKEITVNCDPSVSRSKRHVLGGETEQDPSDPTYVKLAEESLTKYVTSSGITQYHKIIKNTKVVTKIVSGKLTKIDFTASATNCFVDNKGQPTSSVCKIQNLQNILTCHAEILEQLWKNKKDITVSCSPTEIIFKRPILSDDRDVTQNPKDQKFIDLANEALNKYTKDSGYTQVKHKIFEIEKVTTQIVSGILTKLDFSIIPSSCPLEKVNKTADHDCAVFYCHAEVWQKPWMKNENKDLDVSCDDFKNLKTSLTYYDVDNLDPTKANETILFADARDKRALSRIRSGGDQEQDPDKFEYQKLASEAMRKYQRSKKLKSSHKILKVERVVTRVVSGIIYKIDFTAAPTTCGTNVNECDADDSGTISCHTEIWDRPWLKKRKIDVFCNSGNDIDHDNDSELVSDRRKKRSVLNNKIESSAIFNTEYLKDADNSSHNVKTKYDVSEKYNSSYYFELAELALRKFEYMSNAERLHNVTKIYYVTEQEDGGLRVNMDFAAAPTSCLRKETNITACKPLNIKLNCRASINQFLALDHSLVHTIEVDCIDTNKKRKSRRKRSTEPDFEYVEDDLKYYYAGLVINRYNMENDSPNLYKLISIHDVRRSMPMNTPLIRMFIEIAKTYCMRDGDENEIASCNQIEGLSHKTCIARFWPSPNDDYVVNNYHIVCDDDLRSYSAVAGYDPVLLLLKSVQMVNQRNIFPTLMRPLEETYLVPTLDNDEPFKLSFLVAPTNCTYEEALEYGKTVNRIEEDNPCLVDMTQDVSSCRSKIYLSPRSREIKTIDVDCMKVYRAKRSLSMSSGNFTDQELIIQKLVQESLEQLEMQSVHRYKQRVLSINNYKKIISNGQETTIDFYVGYTNCLKFEWVDNITDCQFLEHLPRRHCVSHITEHLFVHNGRRIEVNCDDDETPLEASMELENAENAVALANEALKRIEYKYPHPRRQKVVRIFSLEKQATAGLHYRMKLEVGYTECMALSVDDDCKLDPNVGNNKFCRVNVWVRPWSSHPPSYRVTCDYYEISPDDIYQQVQAEQLFSHFLDTYRPGYIDDYGVLRERFKIFKENVKKIHELNVYEQGTARYAVTRFADLSSEEFRQKYLGLKPKLRDENQVPLPMAEIPAGDAPASFDWREHGAVTEVKDQGMCGSCWAFSVTGNIEGQWKKHSGNLVSLSEQELVDCDTLDQGCNGGLPDNAYRAIEQLGGLETESDYPYDGEQEKCEYNTTLARVQISGAVNISSSETDMVKWLAANGPISIGINANAMQFYVGGISHPWKMLCNPKNLDHGVLIVGYGEKDYPLFKKKLPYWIIKNSWGKSWGEQGYYRVYRGDGTCGVNQMASSAVI